ncbi:MAG TPA: SpoIID/LytB domain-containing protein, partial [Candidatus Polarisedimenticolia bacterium]|nr:SpoIID/LytB domain-containing protein [Candidatus Polarisedimenticolia bacterium]
EIPTQRNVRIGLTTDNVRARVTADGGVLVRDPVKKALIWKKVFEPGLTFVSEVQGHGPLLIYRVQIGSFATREAAEEKQRALETLLPAEKVVVAWNPDRKAWRVRAGEYRSRDEAAALSQRLADEGYREIWIVEEEAEAAGRRRVRLVDDRWHDFLTAGDRVLVSPAKNGAWLKVDQNSYRGTLEVRVDKGGRLRVINELPMEDYLRGVVPNEMGPGVYPELEALKAQAVAARTYIVANLGQYSDYGYDVCDSPSCQVYKGASTEHPLTNQALEETRGVILIWDGKPINAMYTSTCGGHTEDGNLIFPEEKGPYLKGVPCYPEVAGEARTLEGGSWVEPVVLEDGSQANEEVQLVRLHGLVGNEALDARWLAANCSASDAERWVGAALKLAGKTADPAGLAGNRLDLANLAEYLGRSLGWQEKMRIGLEDRDLPYLLAFRDRDEIPEIARRPYALLVLEGILDPFPDNSLRPKHQPSRGLMLRTLYRILDYYQVLEPEPAIYRGSDGGKLILESKKDARVLAVRSDVALFRSFRDVSYPTKSVPLTLGDRVMYHASDDGAVDYLRVNANPRGVSDDRYSSLYRWEERRTREELENLVRQRVDVGTLVDVEPTKRGVSGRVVEVKITGSRGEFTLKGFRIRTAFGVRENLFTIDRTRGPDGKVTSFIFSGKGWGHGLGLCQVGAYGMALRGKRFDEILAHYYSGAELYDTTRAASVAPA